MSKTDARPGSENPPTAPLLPLGRFTKPHGLAGAIVLRIDDSLLAELRKGLVITIDSGEELTVTGASPVKGGARVRLEGVATREAAEALVGKTVSTSRENLSPLEDGEYYDLDILGCDVVTPSGDPLGKIAEVIHTGANDVYAVNGSNGEILVPAIAGVVLEILVTEHRIVVNPEGLVYPDEPEDKR